MLNRLVNVYADSYLLDNYKKYEHKINKSLEVIAPELLPVLEQMEKEIEEKREDYVNKLDELIQLCECIKCNPDE